MTRRAPLHLHRQGLVDRAVAARICLVEAPGGYGKTTFAEDVASASEVARVEVMIEGTPGEDAVLAAVVEAMRQSGLSDLADAAGRCDPSGALTELTATLDGRADALCIVVDEVQRLDDEGATWLARLAAALVPACQIVVVGRQLPGALGRLGRRDDAVHIGVDDLRFSSADVAALVASASGGAADIDRVAAGALEAEIMRLSDGWPAAVALMVSQRLARRPGRDLGPRPLGNVMVELVEGLLAASPEHERESLRRLAAVPLLSQDVALAVAGPGVLERAISLGLPLASRPDGWLRLPDPVREALIGGPLEPARRRAAARSYCASGELYAAVHLLQGAGDVTGLAEVLADRPWAQVEAAGVSFARVVVALVGEQELSCHPELLVLLARAVEQGDRSLRRSLLELADRATAGQDGLQRRSVLAERARDASRQGDYERGDRLARLALEGASPSEIVTRGRALYAWGMADTLRCTDVALARAADALGESAALCELAGEYRWTSEALLRVGYAVSFHGGRIDTAIEQIERALALLPAADLARAITLTYLMDVLDHAGRADEAEAAGQEALAIGHRLGDQTAVGFACWSMAWITAHRGDHAATLEWLAGAERHGGRWIEEANGAEFALAASDMLAGLGDEDGARRYLEQGRERSALHGIDDAAGPAIGRFEAMFGDPDRAEVILADLDGRPFAVPRNRWVRALLRAFAAHRRHDEAAEQSFLRRAEHDAARCGHPDLPARHERWIYERLCHCRGDLSSSPSLAGTRVSLLGRFTVTRTGDDVTPPAGHPAALVKLLALGGPMTVEEVVDRLWPDVDLSTGRSRLRNTLNRLRTRSGDIVERRGDALTLAADAGTDVGDFEAAAAAALTAPIHERAGLARRAAALYGGELLPGDRYEDWAAAPRERLRRRFVAMTDVLATDAEARGDLDEAVRQLDAAMTLEPLDESRPVQAARLLLVQGRRAGARDVVQRALSVLDDLGVAPSPALRALADDVAG